MRGVTEAVYPLFCGEFDKVDRATKKAVNAAWRHAVETWLLQEKIVAVSTPESLTRFSVKLVP
jgi:hypothetical protein